VHALVRRQANPPSRASGENRHAGSIHLDSEARDRREHDHGQRETNLSLGGTSDEVFVVVYIGILSPNLIDASR
jgi:hypothetical protein